MQEDEPAPTLTKKYKKILLSGHGPDENWVNKLQVPSFFRNKTCQYKPLQSQLTHRQEMGEDSMQQS
jgi:hypothetical protein